MSDLSAKEQQLMAAVFKHLDGDVQAAIRASVDWTQVSTGCGYKDARNAKVMWGRLVKKVADAPTAADTPVAAPSAGGAADDAGEGSSKAAASAGKKRKAAGTKAARPTKKHQATGAQFTAINKPTTTEGHGDTETGQEGGEEAAAVSNE